MRTIKLVRLFFAIGILSVNIPSPVQVDAAEVAAPQMHSNIESTPEEVSLPVIGIPISKDAEDTFKMSRSYADRIIQHGGVPVFLPVTIHKSIPQLAKSIDGLLLPGGVDPDPILWGEEPNGTGRIEPDTDRFEMGIIETFVPTQKPILGICRGFQSLNIALKGTLYQDLESQYPQKVVKHAQNAPRWYPTHTIEIDETSLLYKLAGNNQSVRVNSFHHQAVKDLGRGLRPTAHTLDGVVEAFEHDNHCFLLGVQWHPEEMRDSPLTNNLFAEFIKRCNECKQRNARDAAKQELADEEGKRAES